MVLSRIFKSRIQPPAPARVPDGVRVYAIGDIHGRSDCLDELLAAIRQESLYTTTEVRLVFLGDLIDRGPDSRGVVERLMALAEGPQRCDFIKGNHEELLLLAAQGEQSALSVFHRAGARETMLSYGVMEDEYDQCDLQGLSELIVRHVPQAHLDFMESFVDRVSIGDYRFVHAGVRPGRSFEEQVAGDLRWIRREFLEHRQAFDGMVVHGHTIADEPEFEPNRIGIDTGAYATGRLTALGLEGERRWTLQSQAAPATV